MSDPRAAWQSLRYWTLHVLLNASGSFVCACTTDWNNTQAIMGMIAGIIVFIAIYSSIWSSAWFYRYVPVGGLFDRAIRGGTRVRSIIGLAGCVYAPVLREVPILNLSSVIFLPDFYAGAVASDFIVRLGRTDFIRSVRVIIAGPDAAQRAHNLLVGDVNSLVPTFFITLAQGIFLTVMLLGWSLLCWLIMRARARAKAFSSAALL